MRQTTAPPTDSRRHLRRAAPACPVGGSGHSSIAVLSLVAFRENFDIYRTPSGQLLLSAGLAIIAATWWAIWRLSKVTVPERLILVRPHRGTGW